MAAAGEHLYGLVHELHLDAVTVELDLVDPALAAWHLPDRCRRGRLDKPGSRAPSLQSPLFSYAETPSNTSMLLPFHALSAKWFLTHEAGS
jgi:hypothetical protein